MVVVSCYRCPVVCRLHLARRRTGEGTGDMKQKKDNVGAYSKARLNHQPLYRQQQCEISTSGQLDNKYTGL